MNEAVHSIGNDYKYIYLGVCHIKYFLPFPITFVNSPPKCDKRYKYSVLNNCTDYVPFCN